MSNPRFPASLAELPDWQKQQGVASTEARLRFVQYVVLEGIAASPLGRQLVFKGGNALRFVYENRRSTVDLDFSSEPSFLDDGEVIRRQLDDSVGKTAKNFGIRVRCQKVARNPKTAAATFATYQLTLGFVFPGDRQFANFDADARPLPTVVELEISLNEMICEAVDRSLTVNSRGVLRVCSLEDIIAEKLRSLLQQPIRNRSRKQDVLDIATVWTAHANALHLGHIAEYLQRKAQAREVGVSKAAFDEVIRSRAMTDYDQLKRDAGDSFIDFENAWAIVLKLVGLLNIPDSSEGGSSP